MQIAFYKGKGSWVSWCIRKRTNGCYSHVEAVFSDGRSFSSHETEGGVRFKDIDYVKDAADWDLFEFDVSPEDEAVMRKWAEIKAGKRYDFRAIARYLLGMEMPENDRLFCSETMVDMAHQIGRLKFLKASATSPVALWIAFSAMAEDRASRAKNEPALH